MKGPQGSERRPTPSRARDNRGREEPEGAERRRREEGRVEPGRAEEFEHLERLRKDRQAENRRIFAEEILTLVESRGGPVTTDLMRGTIGFRDLGMGVRCCCCCCCC